MTTNLLTTTMQIGKTIITSPAIQGVVSSLITTLFMRRGENIKSQWQNPGFYVGAYSVGDASLDLLEN